MEIKEELEVTIAKDYESLLSKSINYFEYFQEEFDRIKIKNISHKSLTDIINYKPDLLYKCIVYDYYEGEPRRLRLLSKYKINLNLLMDKTDLPNRTSVNIYKFLDSDKVSPISLFMYLSNFSLSEYRNSDRLLKNLYEFITILTKNYVIDEDSKDYFKEDITYIENLFNIVFLFRYNEDIQNIQKEINIIIEVIKLLIKKNAKFTYIDLLCSFFSKNSYAKNLYFPELLKFISKDFNPYIELKDDRNNLDNKSRLKSDIKNTYKYIGNKDKLLLIKTLLKINSIDFLSIKKWNKFFEIEFKNENLITFSIINENRKINYNKILSILDTIKED